MPRPSPLPLLFGLSLGGCAPRHVPPPAPPPSLQEQSFEVAWQRVGESHPDPAMNGVDWQAVHDRLLPRARAADSNEALRPVLQEMLATLGSSHYAVFGPEAEAGGEPGGAGDVGVELRLVDGQVLVSAVSPDGPAAAAGVRAGWALLEVAGRPVETRGEGKDTDALLVPMRAGERLRGAVGSEVKLRFDDGEGAREVVLRRGELPGEEVRFGLLPPVRVRVEHRGLEPGLGLVAFNVFLGALPERFGEALAAMAPLDGLVLDLRGNPGGVAGLASGVAGYLVAERTELGEMRSRDGVLRFPVFPRAASERFDGPLAVLIDPMSASTSELLAGGLQAQGRARLFGERSAGMALPSRVEELPNGDRLQLVFADLVLPDGRRPEAGGVVPDEVVPLRRDDLLAGRDAALEAAVAWLKTR